MKVAFIAVLLSSALISIVAWNPPGCSLSDCSSCYPGWTRIGQSGNYSCQACAPSCFSCDVAGPTKCDNCTLGYIINSASYTCVPCPPNCTNCDSSGPASCDICQDSFYKGTSGLCQRCGEYCQTCQNYSTCASCWPGMFYDTQIGYCNYITLQPSVTGYYVAIILVSVFGLLLTVVGIFVGYQKGKKSFNEDIMKTGRTSVTM